ncbi:MAG: ABC transporter permease [Actinobacteria bacterium]|nr:ABC transporter permease [Actinomycetota bacterium]MDA3017770.1 ABC transporter permease [Actinomycetota bacterium]
MKIKSVAVTIIQFVIVLFLVTFGITLLVRLLPGDPVSTLMPFATEETRLQLSKELGLDANIFQYYFRWLGDFVTGDLGTYYASTGNGGGVAVTEMLAVAFPRTLLLMIYVIAFSLLVSIPVGILLAYRAGTRLDNVISNTMFTISAIPAFALGLGLAFIFGVKLNWVPVLGYEPISQGIGKHIKSMILPTLSLSIGYVAIFSRLLRVDTIATLREDFVTMASSKGLSNSWILWRHVFRPSSSGILTIAGLNMAGLIGGSVFIETVFALNGFGNLLAVSIATRQYLAIQSLVAIVAIAFLVFNLLTDLLYAVVDPRVASHRGA